MPAPRRIWVTRTQPQADTTAAALRAMGLEAVIEPVLAARASADAPIDLTDVEAIAFTSGHAVRAFAAICLSRDLAVFSVGEATASLARSAGFTDVRSAKGDVGDLANLIAAFRPTLVLNPTAREPAADFGALLGAKDVRSRTVAVYETGPSALSAAPAGIDAVLVHSPKAARIVAELVTDDQARRLSAFAISEAAAAPLRALPFARIATAPFPDEASLLNLLQG